MVTKIIIFIIIFTTTALADCKDYINLSNDKINLIEIKFYKEKKFVQHVSKFYLSSKKNESLKNFKKKKKYNAQVIVNYNSGNNCNYDAKLRMHGDGLDHIELINGIPISSLNIQLKNGNINNITKFILFKPNTRNYANEIFAANLFTHLGYLSPRTFKIKVKMLNIESEFIFQESLKKEFLEHNNKVEGPILESKEEFDNSHLKMSKVSNVEWIKENKNKYIVSLNAIQDYNLSLLKSYQFRILAQDETIRLDPKDFDEETFNKISIFDSIMYGIGGAHGLSYDDRRFYYDPLYSKLEPIYYDGNINILSKINYDGSSGKFRNKLKNWQIIDKPFLDIYLNKNRSKKNRHRNPTVTKSAKLGANQSIIILNNINKDKLLETLQNNGLNDLTIKKLNTLFQHIVERLKSISSANVYKDNIQLDDSLYHKYKDEMKIEKNLNLFFINSQTKLSDKKNIFVEKCNYSLESCFSYFVNEKELLDLIEQKASKKVKNIFINVDKNNYRSGNIKKSKNNIRNDFKKFKINESFEIFFNEDVEILLDKKNKIINLAYLRAQGRAIILNSKIDKWSIKMQNLSNNLGNKFENIYNLTGCLTIIDSKLNKVNITGENFVCEDTVNFIRSYGSLNEIIIKNSGSDSVDADFSKLKFFSINIFNSKNDCIDFSYGIYNVENADLQNCADKAISIGEKSIANFDIIKTQDSNIGIAVKDSSKVYINKAKMNRLDTCLSAYKKKQEFNGSYLEVNDFVCDIFINKFISDNKSNIVIKNEL